MTEAAEAAAQPAADGSAARGASSGARPHVNHVKALPKPDKSAFDADVAALQASQERQVARLSVLDARIKERHAARKAGSGDTSVPRQRVQELGAAFKARVVRASL